MAKKEITIPSNIEAEKALIGAIITDFKACNQAVSTVLVEDFYDERHQAIFEAVVFLLYKQGEKVIESSTIAQQLILNKTMDLVGGVPYLIECINSCPSVSNINHYVDIVKEQSLLRKMLTLTQQVLDEFGDKITNPNEFVASVQRRVTQVAEKRKISDLVHSGELITTFKRNLDLLRESFKDNDSMVTGVNTGYSRLNQFTHGFQKGEMYVVGARPSVGKTAFALNIAYNASIKSDIPVIFFSLEMSAQKIMERLVASRSLVALEKIQTGFFARPEQLKLDGATTEISKSAVYIDDTPNIPFMDMASKIRKFKSERPDLGLVVIDYLGLLSLDNVKYDNRTDQVRQLSQLLKGLAKDLQIPIVVLAQLSRKTQEKDGGVPELIHLRESGAIEQDADVVMLLHRPDYQKTGLEENKKHVASPSDNTDANTEKTNESVIRTMYGSDVSPLNVIVAKNRNGKTGLVPLIFFKQYGRIDNPTKEYEDYLIEARQIS